jgi:hypothetical protein
MVLRLSLVGTLGRPGERMCQMFSTKSRLRFLKGRSKQQTNEKRPAAALRDRSHLATGTTAPKGAQRRWPILDVHDVKQQNVSHLRFTHTQRA